MSATHADFLRHLRSVMAKRTGDLSDRQLLESFQSQRSEESFAALVQRHGAMVFGVCRRLLRHTQDAEDAFQATFLALAGQAAAIRQQESLGSWLHGVAYRIAARMKRTAARRAVHEGRLRPRPPSDALEDITWHELRAVLDEELQRLPEQYRVPLVLCYLEARTQDEAARQLGWSKNTFGRRLNQARQLLAQRLTRRGLTLPAVLTAPLLIDGAASAALPPLLAANTVRAGLAVAMGNTPNGIVSVQVVALGESSVAALSSKSGSVILVLLVSVVLGTVGWLGHRTLCRCRPAEVPVEPKSTPPLPPPRSANKGSAIEIKGRVLGPDGKPLAGARLLLHSDVARKKADATVRAVSDSEGGFCFPGKPADFDARGKATIVATAKDLGLDWMEIETKNKDALTLRLVQDDVPLKGRVLDLEGKPVANVTVRVLKLHQADLDWWLKELKRGRVYYPKSIEPAALSTPVQTITGADGRFQLHGLGRERLAYLMIEGATIERIRCWALTRDGKNLDLPKGGEPIYPAAFDHIAAPTKPIVGTVRDKSTGKPLAGITVYAEHWINSATTDERGRYRIIGNRKEREYGVTAVGKPYFVLRKRSIADTPGLQPLIVDFELERGIEIAGRVFNKATGEPIQAEITYHALADNPYLKNVSKPDHGEGNFVDGRTHGKADGSFFVIGLPGPGYLTVLAVQDDYHKPKRPADWEKLVPYVISAPPLCHAWVRINPSENDPKSLRCDIALEPAKPIPGQALDPDGKPLSGFFVAGLTGSPMILSNQLDLHKKPTFQIRGFDPGRPRTLIFIHPQRKLGKVVVVRENPREPLQVRLQPLGAVAGRVLDTEGRPRTGLLVRVEISREDDNLLPTLSLFEHTRWYYHLDPAAKTDAAGKFCLEGLMPGLKYTLLIGEGDGKSLTRTVIRRENTTVQPGKIKDLGDL